VQAQNNQTINRSSLGQEVTQRLRDMIRRGEFGPRQRLVEVELARHLGTSRTPVREGLLRLEQDGLLQRRPQGGFQVRPISRAEVEEVVGQGVAFRTSGCPGKFRDDVSACDRPYGDSPPSNIASFPFQPNKKDIKKIRRQLGIPNRLV